jgi:hypothetical protein
LKSVIFAVLNFRFRILSVDLFDEGEVLHEPRSKVAGELVSSTEQAIA